MTNVPTLLVSFVTVLTEYFTDDALLTQFPRNASFHTQPPVSLWKRSWFRDWFASLDLIDKKM